MSCNHSLTGAYFSLFSLLCKAVPNPHVKCGIALLHNIGRSLLSYPGREKTIAVSRPVIFQIKGKKEILLLFVVLSEFLLSILKIL